MFTTDSNVQYIDQVIITQHSVNSQPKTVHLHVQPVFIVSRLLVNCRSIVGQLYIQAMCQQPHLG